MMDISNLKLFWEIVSTCMIEFSLVKYPELGDRFSQSGAHFNLITSSSQLSMPGLCAHTVINSDV